MTPHEWHEAMEAASKVVEDMPCHWTPEQCAASLRRLPFLQAQPSPPVQEAWISVDERLPEDEEEVLAHGKDCVSIGAWIDGRWEDQNGWTFDPLSISHWMPLPAAPTNRSTEP